MPGSVEDKKVVVDVPATSANLGPGFDTFGMALNLYNRYSANIIFEDSPEWPLVKDLKYPVYWDIPEVARRFIPTGEKNLVFRAIHQLLQERDVDFPPIRIKMDLGVPLSRGLGSSANAIVGGLFIGREILRKFYDFKFSLKDLQYVANRLEGHPDNVTPAIFGGFCFCYGNEIGDYIVQQIKHPVQLLLLVPHYSLSTSEARSLLPANYRVDTAVFNLRAAFMWQKFLESGDEEILTRALQDRLHQPYRGKLIGEFEPVTALARENGALGTVISGAGPSLLVFGGQDTNMIHLEGAIADYAQKAGRRLDILRPQIDTVGARLIESF